MKKFAMKIRTEQLWVAIALSLCMNAPAHCQEEDNQAAASPEPAKKGYSAEAVKHYNTGLKLHQSGYLQKAIEEYKQAIAADDSLEQAYSNLGLIYISQKSYALAQEAFDKALRLKPNRPTSLNGLASVLYARGQTAPAIEKWQKAVEVDPRFASAYFNMGTALEAQKKTQEALKVYFKAVSIAPDMADAFYHMGNLFNKEKHPAQALILLRRSVDLAPESEFARDARKQIASIETQFAKESGKDVRRSANGSTTGSSAANGSVSGSNSNTIAPLGTNGTSSGNASRTQSPSVGASREDIAESAARAVERKQLEKERKAEAARKAKDEKSGGLFGLGKKKAKSDANLKMFVQQPQEGDLKKSEQ